MKLDIINISQFSNQIGLPENIRWAEILFISILPPVLGYFLNYADPFFLELPFPILIFPPLLLALRYGLCHGVISFTIIAIGLVTTLLLQKGYITGYSCQILIGTFIATLLVGESVSQWRKLIGRYQTENDFTSTRFAEFTHAYHVMKVSHDQLKEEFANSRFSLREALQAVRRELNKQYEKENGGLSYQVGNELLAIFSYFCSVQVAGVYAATKTGQIETRPLASHGKMFDITETDSLVSKAIQEGKTINVKAELYASGRCHSQSTDLLAVIPIKDVSGYLWGIIAIAEMEFKAFQEENLNLMQLLGGYTGDLLSQAGKIFYDNKGRERFIGELESCWRMARQFNINSSIVCINFPGSNNRENKEKYIQAIMERARGLDYTWLLTDKRNKKNIICLLMPLMTQKEYSLYRTSLNSDLGKKLGLSTIEDIGGSFHHQIIDGKKRIINHLNFISEIQSEQKELIVDDQINRLLPTLVVPEDDVADDLNAQLERFNSVIQNTEIQDLAPLSPDVLSIRPVTRKLDLSEMQWLFRTLVHKTPMDIGFSDFLWSKSLVKNIALDKFTVILKPIAVVSMLNRMGFPPDSIFYKAIIESPQLVLDWQVHVLPNILHQARKAAAMVFFLDHFLINTDFQKEMDERGYPVNGSEKIDQLTMFSAVHSQGKQYFSLSRTPSVENLCLFLEKLKSQAGCDLYLIGKHHPMYSDPILVDFFDSSNGAFHLFYLPQPIGEEAA